MHPTEHPITKHDLSAFGWLFVGGLFQVLRLGVGRTSADGTGFNIDLFDDTFGMLLIVVGLSKLSTLVDAPRFRTAMKAVLAVAVLTLAYSVGFHWIPSPTELPQPVDTLFFLARLGAILTFCTCMRQLSLEIGSVRAAKGWSITMLTSIAIYVVPYLVLTILSLVSPGVKSVHYDMGLPGLFFVPVAIAPLVGMMASARQMKIDIDPGPALRASVKSY